MDSQGKNATEAQTTKVADMETTNGGDMGADAPMGGPSQGGNILKSECPHQDTPKTENTTTSQPQQVGAATPQDVPPRSPEQSTKRHASRSPSPDNKRQRTSQSPTAARHSASPVSSRPPPREAASSRVRPDEKARSRRLFGGMLSTIAAKPSQRSARPEPKKVDSAKREELERRAAERERLHAQEEEDARRERELRHREENKEKYAKWEKDTILAKADNERLKAEFLRTNAKPHLYHKPYILTKDQNETIQRQAEDTEAQIENERTKYEDSHPDQPPLPLKPIVAKDSMDIDNKEESGDETPQVSAPIPDTNMAAPDEPVSKLDGSEEKEQRKEKVRTDEFDEDVIETSEGGVSLIY